LLNNNPLSTGCALVEAPISNHTSYSVLQESPENPVKDSGKEFPCPRSEYAPIKAVADVELNDVSIYSPTGGQQQRETDAKTETDTKIATHVAND
jgi:hypothetical protein